MRRVIGALSIILGTSGMAIQVGALTKSWRSELPGFWILQNVEAVLLLGLIFAGIQLCRERKYASATLVTVITLEVIYLAMLSSAPNDEIRASFGVMTMGFYPQVITVFPLWGILTVIVNEIYVRRRAQR